jgi:hypothetical protein
MIVLLSVFSMASTGCIGRMALVGTVMKFNLSVTENKWGRELVYLIFYIIPVYEFAGLIDVLIINSIEFHTGTNPLSGQPRLAHRVIESPDGARAESVLREDGSLSLDLTEKDGTHHRVQVAPVGGGFEVRDESGAYLGHVDRDGRMFSRDGEVHRPQS